MSPHHSHLTTQTTCQLSDLPLLLIVQPGLLLATLVKGLNITSIAILLLVIVSVLIRQPVIGIDSRTLMSLMTRSKTSVMCLSSFI